MMWNRHSVRSLRILALMLCLLLLGTAVSFPKLPVQAAGMAEILPSESSEDASAEKSTVEVAFAGVGKILPDSSNLETLAAGHYIVNPVATAQLQPGALTEPTADQILYFAASIPMDALRAKAKAPYITAADLRAEQQARDAMTPEELAAEQEAELAVQAMVGKIGVADVSQSLNVRQSQSEESELVGRLLRGSGAYITDIDGDWTRISSGEVDGWVLSQYLLTDEAAEKLVMESQPQVATVVVEELCVRREADDESDILTTVTTDMQFPVLEVKDNWLKIQLTSQTEGYIHAEYASVAQGLFVAVTADEEAAIQSDLDQREADRQALAERARQAALAAQEAERKSSGSSGSKKSSSKKSSSSSSSSSDGWVSLGTFKITAYCPCSKCNGSSSGTTASGASMEPGWTIAADTSVISMGTVVKIEGLGERKVQDTGVYGNTIDLLVSSHSETYNWGVRYREVWVKR